MTTSLNGAATVERVLRQQAGVVSRAQALRVGTTAREIDRLVARRRWVPVHPRVYLAASSTFTAEARVRAAVLWAGDGAVLGGLAAVWWHGLLPVLTAAVTVTVPRRCPDPRPTKIGHLELLHLLHGNFAGPVYPVNPARDPGSRTASVHCG